MICPTCSTENKSTNKACFRCGHLLSEDSVTPRGNANSLWYSDAGQKSKPQPPPFWGDNKKGKSDYDNSQEFIVLNDEEANEHIAVDLLQKGVPLPSNRTKLSGIKSGREVHLVVPQHPKRTRIHTRRFNVNWKRFAVATCMIIVLSAAAAFGLFTGYKWVVGVASQWFADKNGTAPAMEPLVEKILIDGEPWHRVTFFGRDGEQVLVTNPHRPLSIQNGKAILMLDDQSFIPADLTNENDKVTVELEATMFATNGDERKVIIPPYIIEVPLSPLKIILPKDQTTPTDDNLMLVKVKITPGSRVIIGKNNRTDSVDSQGYVSSYVPLEPIGTNNITITVETKKYRPNNFILKINRPKMDVPITLDTNVKTTTEDSTVEIRGSTKPGATITTNAKLAGSTAIVSDKVSGNFSFTVTLKRWGMNKIAIMATAANGVASSMTYCVTRTPTLENYTKKAWIVEYAYLTTATENLVGNVYVIQGVPKSKLENEDSDYYLFNIGTTGDPKFLVVEYTKESGLKIGQYYKLFADVTGVVDNYPALTARFVYSLPMPASFGAAGSASPQPTSTTQTGSK